MVHTLRNLLQELLVAFCVLNRIQFSAPWKAQRGGC